MTGRSGLVTFDFAQPGRVSVQVDAEMADRTYLQVRQPVLTLRPFWSGGRWEESFMSLFRKVTGRLHDAVDKTMTVLEDRAQGPFESRI